MPYQTLLIILNNKIFCAKPTRVHPIIPNYVYRRSKTLYFLSECFVTFKSKDQERVKVPHRGFTVSSIFLILVEEPFSHLIKFCPSAFFKLVG